MFELTFSVSTKEWIVIFFEVLKEELMFGGSSLHSRLYNFLKAPILFNFGEGPKWD